MSGRAKLDALLAETEVIFGLILPPDITARAPKLKWVQMMSAGVDRLTQSDIWQSAVTITGVSGITAATIGEFVLGFMLMFGKRVPRWFEQKRQHRWHRFPTTMLHGKTAGMGELRFKFGGVQNRLIGYFGPHRGNFSRYGFQPGRGSPSFSRPGHGISPDQPPAARPGGRGGAGTSTACCRRTGCRSCWRRATSW